MSYPSAPCRPRLPLLTAREACPPLLSLCRPASFCQAIPWWWVEGLVASGASGRSGSGASVWVRQLVGRRQLLVKGTRAIQRDEYAVYMLAAALGLRLV